MANKIGSRLREAHMISDEKEGTNLIYDVERTFVMEIPANLAGSLSRFQLEGSLDFTSIKSEESLQCRWMAENDLLTLKETPPLKPPKTSLVLTDLSLDIAGRCNLDCVYCFEKDLRSRLGPMSEETARNSVDFLFANSANSKHVALHFGSGEPLTNFDLMKKVVQYAEEHATALGKQLCFHLTTNGTMISKAVAEFLAAHEFYVRISIDAVYHGITRQDVAGKDTYELVVKGFLALRDILGRKLTVNVVFCNGMRLREIYEWALKLGVVNLEVIKVGGIKGDTITPGNYELLDFRNDLRWIADDLCRRATEDLPLVHYLPLTKTLRRLMGPAPTERFCGVASTYLGISSRGDAYPCFRHLGLDNYQLGNVTNGVDDIKRLQYLSREAQSVDVRPVCSECWARKLCGGGCYADSVVYGPDKTAPQLQHCPFWKTEIEVGIILFNRLVNENPTLLFKLIGRDDPLSTDTQLQTYFTD